MESRTVELWRHLVLRFWNFECEDIEFMLDVTLGGRGNEIN